MIEFRHVRHPSYSTQEEYNEIFKEKGILLHESFYIWLLGLLEPIPGKLLLDVSCGQGRISILAHERKIKAYGVDFSVEAVRSGYQQKPEVGWAVSDGEQLPFPHSSFDYVMNIGSLEHYINPEAGMSEIARILKPDGKACILLPNTFSILLNIIYAWRTGRIFDDGQPLQRYNTRMGWNDMLVKNGLFPYRTLKYQVEWPRTKQDVLWYLRSPLKIPRLFYTRLVPLNLANCFVYLCHSKYQKKDV